MNKRIVDREKAKRYIAKHNSCSMERAEQLINEGVEKLTWLNIKYIGFGKYEITIN